jgi:hypothetical protein
MSSWNAADLVGVFAADVEQDVKETSTRLTMGRTLSQMGAFVIRCDFARFIAISLANPAARASHRGGLDGRSQF